jgi:glycosyltransferase involved in cell wall biosynthesis
MWQSHSISVLLPTFKEKDSIRQVVLDFESMGICDEIIVINNNAEIGTSEEIQNTSAIEYHESNQGYGAAIKRGIKESKGDFIVICEPDSTFDPVDLLKLLPFTDRCNAVYGSRTIDNYIWTGANMGLFLKWGNWFVAKMLELLYNSTYLSDVGCTFRILKREKVSKLDFSKFTDDGRFGMELLLSALMAKESMVQVPVNYMPRIGESGYTGNHIGAAKLGFRMIFLILNRRFTKRRGYYAS